MPARATLADFSGGINTKLPAWKIGTNQWQALENAVVKNGQATPLKGLGSAITTIGASTLAWLGKLGSTWLGSTTARYSVKWQDEYYAYVTSGGAGASWTNGTLTEDLGGVGPSTGLITSAIGAAGLVNGADLTWVVTNVTAMGQESAPNLPSAPLTVTLDTVNLTNIPLGPTGTTSRRIYRSVSGIYRLVTTLADNVTTTHSDNTSDLNLGDPLLTEDANLAPALTGLAVDVHIARLWGFYDNVLRWSNTGTPSAWSTSSLSFNDNIRAACKTNRGLLVLTATTSYFVIQDRTPTTVGGVYLGTSTDETFAIESTNNTFGCAAPFSLVQTDRGPMWWDDQGLVLYDGQGFVLITADVFTDEQIDAISTTGMKAEYSKGFYYLVHSAGTIIVDIRSQVPTFTTSTLTGSDLDALYAGSDGTFYAADGFTVKEWNSGDNLTMRIKSREFIGGDVNMPFFATYCDVYTSGSVTAQWLQDGSAWGTAEVVSSLNGYARCWSEIGNQTRCAFQASSTSAITQMEVA
jgi:hypothetical protein